MTLFQIVLWIVAVILLVCGSLRVILNPRTAPPSAREARVSGLFWAMLGLILLFGVLGWIQ